ERRAAGADRAEPRLRLRPRRGRAADDRRGVRETAEAGRGGGAAADEAGAGGGVEAPFAPERRLRRTMSPGGGGCAPRRGGGRARGDTGSVVMQVACPHCHSAIERAESHAADEITCPSCGSSFRLEREATTDYKPPGPQRLGKFELLDSLGQG